MKKIILLLSAALVFISCSKVGKDEYLITGTAKGIDNGKTIILETQDVTGMMLAKDTVKVENGKFEMKGNITEPAFYTLQLEGAQAKIPFILENAEVVVEINKDSIQKSKVSGTYNNDEYMTFNEEITKVQKPLMDFQTKNMAAMQAAQQKNDQTVINQLMGEFAKIQEDVTAKSKAKYNSYAESHPKSFISALIVQGMLNDPSMDVAKAEKMYNGLDESLKKTKPGLAIKTKLAEMKAPAAVGATPAPAAPSANWRADFSAPNPEGKVISLKESLGKVTIVDFWASWCGPCRRENPNVVALYKELHSKGLNIVGVSLDKDAKAWKEAIAKDNLTWTHVSNLKFWDEPIAAQYKVQSIPATFILDASGKVVAKDLRGDALRAKVIELLKK